MLSLQLEGEGRILGVGNGNPSFLGEDHPKELDCHKFSIPAFNGLAQVLLQSNKKAGKLRLTCTSEKMETILEINSEEHF
jgi:beta-galactosidase